MHIVGLTMHLDTSQLQDVLQCVAPLVRLIPPFMPKREQTGPHIINVNISSLTVVLAAGDGGLKSR